MNPEQKAAWDAYYEPENQSFLHQMKEGSLSEKEITQWKYQRYMHDYLGSVQAVDDSVDGSLDYLDQNQLSENTIVIYSSDQGFYLGEHGWYDKRWMFEESLKMPFLVRWPGKIQPALAPRPSFRISITAQPFWISPVHPSLRKCRDAVQTPLRERRGQNL